MIRELQFRRLPIQFWTSPDIVISTLRDKFRVSENGQLKGETKGGSMSVNRLVIEAGRAEHHYWRDLWRFRELFLMLAWRDLAVRYKQTIVGVAWSVLRPFLTMVIFTVVFGKLGNFPSGGVPYPLLVYAALLPWQLFANALSDSGNSLVGNVHLISKVYFPRLIIPATALIVSLVDFFISMGVMAALMLWYGFWPSASVLALPLFIVAALLAAMGPGLLLTALTVKYRDFRFITPFIVQIGLFISPVAYSSSLVREKFPEIVYHLYCLNPMVGVIDGFRWALLGSNFAVNWSGFAVSFTVSTLMLLIGIWYFRRTERRFADVI